jgi:hypothetical protein
MRGKLCRAGVAEKGLLAFNYGEFAGLCAPRGKNCRNLFRALDG